MPRVNISQCDLNKQSKDLSCKFWICWIWNKKYMTYSKILTKKKKNNQNDQIYSKIILPSKKCAFYLRGNFNVQYT